MVLEVLELPAVSCNVSSLVVSFTAEWYWKCWGYQLCLALSAIIMSVLSAMVVWSECLFFVRSPTLSLFAVLVNAARTSYNYRAIEVRMLIAVTSEHHTQK